MLKKNMAKLRLEKGWTQRTLADKSKIPYYTIIKIERGAIKDPRISTVVKLSKTFKVSLDILIKK